MKATNLDLGIALTLLLLMILGFYGFGAFLITSLLTLILLFNSDKSTVGVFLIWIFFNSSGMWSEIFKIPKAGLLSLIIAIPCFYFGKFNHKIDFIKPLSDLVPVFIIFLFFFLYGPMHSYSYEKIIFIVYKGILYLIGFLVLILNPKINFLRISLLILLSAFQYYSYVTLTTGWPGVENFFEIGSLRNYYTVHYFDLENETLVNYQSIGLLGLISFSFILNLIPNKNSYKKNDIFFFVVLIISIFLILYSGSRQSIYPLPIIYIAFLIFSKKQSLNSKKWSLFLGVLMSFYFITPILGDKESNLGLSKGDSFIEKINRPTEIMHAINLIESKPLLGHGLGGFSTYIDHKRYYPHNIFLELLSETGILGLVLLLIYIIIFIQNNNISMYNNSNSGFLILPVFIAIFIRANLSSDLMENVDIFSFIIAWGGINSFFKKKILKGYLNYHKGIDEFYVNNKK